jgi:serine/threonine protein kinase
LKIIDFGFAHHFKGDASLVDFLGSPLFIAPEIINKERYGSKCDVWSLGVITYFLCSNTYPFMHDDREELFELISKGHFTFEGKEWESVTDKMKDFIRRCLTLDQHERWSTE